MSRISALFAPFGGQSGEQGARTRSIEPPWAGAGAREKRITSVGICPGYGPTRGPSPRDRASPAYANSPRSSCPILLHIGGSSAIYAFQHLPASVRIERKRAFLAFLEASRCPSTPLFNLSDSRARKSLPHRSARFKRSPAVVPRTLAIRWRAGMEGHLWPLQMTPM